MCGHPVEPEQPRLPAAEVPGVEVPLPAVVEDLHRLHLSPLGGGASLRRVVEAQLSPLLHRPGEDAQLGRGQRAGVHRAAQVPVQPLGLRGEHLLQLGQRRGQRGLRRRAEQLRRGRQRRRLGAGEPGGLAEALVEVDPHLVVLHVEVDEVVGLEGRPAHHGEQLEISEQLLAADAQLPGERLHRHPLVTGDVGNDEEQPAEPLVDVAHAAPRCRAATASASARKRARAGSGCDHLGLRGERQHVLEQRVHQGDLHHHVGLSRRGAPPARRGSAPRPGRPAVPPSRSRTSTGGSIRHCQGACGTWASMSNPAGSSKSWVRGLLGFIFSPRIRWTWKVRRPWRRWQ